MLFCFVCILFVLFLSHSISQETFIGRLYSIDRYVHIIMDRLSLCSVFSQRENMNNWSQLMELFRLVSISILPPCCFCCCFLLNSILMQKVINYMADLIHDLWIKRNYKYSCEINCTCFFFSLFIFCHTAIDDPTVDWKLFIASIRR